jgi:N6-adenosine-specific RNA methylase IME4
MKYRTIVIDPPWRLSCCNENAFSHSKITKDLPYETMSDSEIMAFDVDQFADEQCDLFLWTTPAKIHTAFHVLEAWNFRYANFFAWNKLDGLNFNGVHNILEFVLYAYRGKNGLNYSRPIDTYFAEKRVKHSQKPNKFYSLIAKVTSEPRVDLFARRRHIGFDAWGNQVEPQIQVPLFILSDLPSRKEQTP